MAHRGTWCHAPICLNLATNRKSRGYRECASIDPERTCVKLCPPLFFSFTRTGRPMLSWSPFAETEKRVAFAVGLFHSNTVRRHSIRSVFAVAYFSAELNAMLRVSLHFFCCPISQTRSVGFSICPENELGRLSADTAIPLHVGTDSQWSTLVATDSSGTSC